MREDEEVAFDSELLEVCYHLYFCVESGYLLHVFKLHPFSPWRKYSLIINSEVLEQVINSVFFLLHIVSIDYELVDVRQNDLIPFLDHFNIFFVKAIFS